eukprot:g2677.t1
MNHSFSRIYFLLLLVRLVSAFETQGSLKSLLQGDDECKDGTTCQLSALQLHSISTQAGAANAVVIWSAAREVEGAKFQAFHPS